MPPSPLAAGKHTSTLNNLAINYTVLANSANLPPIIVHPPPWGIGSELYINSFSRLASKYTVIIPSPRGNDDSERPASPEEMSSRHIVSDLEALRLHLGLEQFHAVIGHSSGGTIALGYAITHPKCLERLILLNSDLLGYKRQDVSFFNEVLGLFSADPPSTDEEFRAFMLKILPLYFCLPDLGGPEAFVKNWTTNPSLWAYGAYYAADSASAPGEGAPGDGNAKWKQIDELGHVEARTLVIAGEEDRTCPLDVSATIAQGVKRSRCAFSDACGHMSFVERPDFVWPVVDGFLEETFKVEM
ncbi:hypothetical protein H2200_001568 [Cladophialophora chaetospira]|uniref:AB hydrolase-1 domain-containing protein n=1 Tax=Cladophialophora chaetospira TaxID=386627 RepID=A0AA38XM50_9EURO|nr:hypothetical protein H2200_001568 [Cladophialophora chaetospira]